MKKYIIQNQLQTTWVNKWSTFFLETYQRPHLDSIDGELNDGINKIPRYKVELENLMKNQIRVFTSVIKSFNSTIQKLQKNEFTYNEDIKDISKNSLHYPQSFPLSQQNQKYLSTVTIFLQKQLLLILHYLCKISFYSYLNHNTKRSTSRHLPLLPFHNIQI